MMRIIAFSPLRTFFEKPEYADSEASLRAWYHDAKAAEWINSNELRQQFKNASIVGEGRVVFNIKGNAYRLVVAIDYEFQVIFVRFIGTHKQYDKIDVKTI
jgi:mRNA interferase HigB